MKKLLSFILILAVALTHGKALLAQSDSISFFEALGNFGKLNGYKLIQSFYGNMELEEYEDHLTGEYRLTFNTVTDNDNRSSFSRVSAYMKFVNLSESNDSTPFKEMAVQANGEVIVKNQEEIYFKLNNFNISMMDAEPYATLDVENWISMSELYKGVWFHVTASELTAADGEFNNDLDIEKYIEFENEFKEEPKEAILSLTEQALEDSDADLTETEVQQVLGAMGLALNTNLFIQRDVVAGRNTGFKFFNMSKSAIMGFFVELGKIIGEELTEEDLSEIRNALGKVSISGIYRIEDTLGVIDNLLVRLRLSDIELVKWLEVNYRYKLSDLNEENKISAPGEYEEWYFGDDNLNESWFEGEEF